MNLDSSLSPPLLLGAIPSLVLVVLVGCMTGVASMLAYWRLSPQGQLESVGERATMARRQLHAFDGDEFGEYQQLAYRAVALSLTQLKLVLLPTLIAMLPVFGLAYWLDHLFQLGHRPLWDGDTTWLNSWATLFWGPLAVAALAMKLGLGIK